MLPSLGRSAWCSISLQGRWWSWASFSYYLLLLLPNFFSFFNFLEWHAATASGRLDFCKVSLMHGYQHCQDFFPSNLSKLVHWLSWFYSPHRGLSACYWCTGRCDSSWVLWCIMLDPTASTMALLFMDGYLLCSYKGDKSEGCLMRPWLGHHCPIFTLCFKTRNTWGKHNRVRIAVGAAHLLGT